MKKRFFLTIIIASLLCLFFYYADNKYQDPGTQGANGLLVVSEKDLENFPSRFLTSGWAFYPDVLLSPSDFEKGMPSHYMTYTTIGEKTRFDLNGMRDTPHGSGTYMLRLRLPQAPRTYALDLPEIFSAYRLYINDTLLLEIGNPDPENYVPLTNSQLITFEASGEVTLLFAVSDFSHYYSGMVYPPSFGLPHTLMRNRDFRLGTALMVNTLFALVGCLALYLWLRLKHPNAGIFSLMCFVMCLFTAYLLLHTQYTLPIQPWYALELASGYLIMLLIIILINRICQVAPRLRFISILLATLSVILALCYGLFSAYLTVKVIHAFSLFVNLSKVGTSLYLLWLSIRSLKLMERETLPLFYAAVFYTTCLLLDRLLPSYEPISGGWFTEWGGITLIIAIGYMLWRDLVQAYNSKLLFEEAHRQTARQLDMQLAYTQQLFEGTEANRRLTHDFRHHLRTLTGLAEQAHATDVLHYMEQIVAITRPQQSNACVPFVSHLALDALLQYYHTAATTKGIAIAIRLSLPDVLPLDEVDFCTLLGNLIENAIEACERLSNDTSHILIASHQTDSQLFMIIENTYDGVLKRQGKHFVSRKTSAPRLGVGVASVQTLVSSCGGFMDLYPTDTLFKVSIMLPLHNHCSSS
ncbi:MAG: ATP-binding protein [Cellulosilyticaceae bacterium]